MTRLRRPLLLAVVAEPGQESQSPGGTLLTTLWRGARGALLTLHGAGEPAARATARAALQYGVEPHFHWREPGPEGALRLARVLRALQPTLLLVHPAASELATAAWEIATAPDHPMPALAPLDPAHSRLWQACEMARAQVRVEISAALPLLRAARLYYYPTLPARSEPGHPVGEEGFELLRGAPLPATPDRDLWMGLTAQPPRPPVTFLSKESSQYE